MVWLPRNKKQTYWLNSRSQMWPLGLTLAMTLTLNIQGQIWNLLYLSQKLSDCHEMKSKHIDWTPGLKCDQWVWPWPWPLTLTLKLEMDQNKIPFSIFLDLSKAFDTLNHDISLTKLRYYGIEGVALNWFQSYLTKHTQFVQYNDTSSSIREIETGVPQGSILGPLLFVIYINDIHTVSQKFTFVLYADDTTLISPLCSFIHSSQSDMNYVSTMKNMELSKISDRLAVNKLSLNTAKTKFMLFHNYQKTINEDDIPQLTINNTIIERVTEFNFWGLTINKFMNWNSHASKISNKISHTLGVMNRLKCYLPLSAMKLMYWSLVLSHLQFAITSCGFEWERLSKLQKRAIRVMTNSKYNAHTDPLFKSLKLLKIRTSLICNAWKFGLILWTIMCQPTLLPC